MEKEGFVLSDSKFMGPLEIFRLAVQELFGGFAKM